MNIDPVTNSGTIFQNSRNYLNQMKEFRGEVKTNSKLKTLSPDQKNFVKHVFENHYMKLQCDLHGREFSYQSCLDLYQMRIDELNQILIDIERKKQKILKSTSEIAPHDDIEALTEKSIFPEKRSITSDYYVGLQNQYSTAPSIELLDEMFESLQETLDHSTKQNKYRKEMIELLNEENEINEIISNLNADLENFQTNHLRDFELIGLVNSFKNENVDNNKILKKSRKYFNKTESKTEKMVERYNTFFQKYIKSKETKQNWPALN